MNFDINDIEASRNTTFNVVVGFDVDKKRDVGFVVVGTNSPQYAEADLEVRAFNIKANAERAQDKRVLQPATDEGAMEVARVVDVHRQMYLDKCVVGWFGFAENGQDVEFSTELFRRVMAARPGWALRLITAIEDEQNFVKG